MQIQVAHFEPDTIVLTGEGIFPCITFNVPRVETSLTPQAEKNTPAEGDATDTASDERVLQVSFYSTGKSFDHLVFIVGARDTASVYQGVCTTTSRKSALKGQKDKV